MVKMKALDYIAIVLLIVGGLNWGLAVFDFNLVSMVTMNAIWLSKVIYGLVGISAIYSIWSLIKLAK